VNEEQRSAEVNAAVLDLYKAKVVRDTADELYKEASKKYLKALDAEGIDTLSTEHDGKRITATKVQSHTLNIDEAGLSDEVPRAPYVKVTVKEVK